MNTLFKKALWAEKEGSFYEALLLYRQLAEKVSTTAYKFNIARLEKILNLKPGENLENCLYLSESYRARFGPNHPFLKFWGDSPESFKSLPKFPIERWPDDLALPSVEGLNNDYTPIRKIKDKIALSNYRQSNISIVIPYFERPDFLPLILNSIIQQRYSGNIEVIVSDDGSKIAPIDIIRTYEKKIDLKYIRRPNLGYTLNMARNAGCKLASNEVILILDSDIVLPEHFLHELASWFYSYSKLLIMGYRKFISLEENKDLLVSLHPDWELSIVETISENAHMPQNSNMHSVDWRLNKFNNTDWLVNEIHPFRMLAGCMMAFKKKDWEDVGMFDEEFNQWGCEDLEFGYRFYRHGAYFIADEKIYGYHLEPLEGENETLRDQSDMQKLLFKKVPILWRNATWDPWPKLKTEFANTPVIPSVSVQMPAYNSEKHIKAAIESVQSQSFDDWELVICDDGSTDSTSDIIKSFMSTDSRIKLITQENMGIKSARIATQKRSLGQFWCMLDSDDILHPECIKRTMQIMKEKSVEGVGVVYTNNCTVNEKNELGETRWSIPQFSREHLLLNMIVHHFRLIDSKYWNRSVKFCDHLRSAEDMEMMLILSNYCKFYHLNESLYGYRQHDGMSSITNMQKLYVQDGLRYRFLDINGISGWKILRPDPNDPKIITYRQFDELELNNQIAID